ncbi:MAG: hypothetical protein AABX39_02215 [Nanoarchaeota archaeon]
MGAYDISSKCYSSRKDALQEIEKRLNKRRKLEAKYNREVTVTALSVTESRGYFSAYAQYNVTKESHVVGMRGVDDETVFGESKDTKEEAISSLEQKIAKELVNNSESTKIGRIRVDEDVLNKKFLAYAHLEEEKEDESKPMSKREIKKFWDSVHYTAAEVDEWPEWKKEGVR